MIETIVIGLAYAVLIAYAIFIYVWPPVLAVIAVANMIWGAPR